MTLKQFLLFHFNKFWLKVYYPFCSKETREKVISMIQRELEELKKDNEYGKYQELISEVTELCNWLLTH